LARRIVETTWGRRVAIDLERAGVSVSVARWLAGRAAATAGAAALVLVMLGARAVLLATLAGAAGWVATERWLARRRTLRHDALVAQLPEAAMLVANGLRAGRSAAGAVAAAAGQLGDPLGPLLERASAEVALGDPVDSALERMAARAGSAELDVMVTAIVVGRQAGGDLAAALARLAEAMTDRARLRRELRGATAQARFTCGVVLALPAAAAGAVSLVEPSFLAVLVAGPPGWAVLGLSGTLLGTGVLAVRRIARVPA
jgi:tight adherence protein B